MDDVFALRSLWTDFAELILGGGLGLKYSRDVHLVDAFRYITNILSKT